MTHEPDMSGDHIGSDLIKFIDLMKSVDEIAERRNTILLKESTVEFFKELADMDFTGLEERVLAHARPRAIVVGGGSDSIVRAMARSLAQGSVVVDIEGSRFVDPRVHQVEDRDEHAFLYDAIPCEDEGPMNRAARRKAASQRRRR